MAALYRDLHCRLRTATFDVREQLPGRQRHQTLVWNGPFGAFETEPFDIGTDEVAEAAAELTVAGKLVSVAGGGDTVAALNAAGVTGRFTYVSTAGGAFLEWMEGKPLPGVEVLKAKSAALPPRVASTAS
jgi:3-phosphoglycerate kinase